jgi:exodeoxyribonuclease VII large subunit
MNEKRLIYTVSQLTRQIKEILEEEFPAVWVEGEISNFRAYPSGHFYFTLKDKEAVLSAAIFNGVQKQIKFKLEDGLKVICFGRIELYPPHGQYKIAVEKIEPKGLGSLQLALEQLKQRLEKEGLFSPEHKRPIPYLPYRVGIVTSAQGAAIRDILKVLERRFKDTHIILNPAKVQGEGAKEEIARAIKEFNLFNETLEPEERIGVLIVGRGGGSTEDLWAFNEEVVARAIYQSKIPVISAVGHERDQTIADLVADLRAPTPSAAAEMVLPKKEDLREKVSDFIRSLKRALLEIIAGTTENAEDLLHRLNINISHSLELNSGRFQTASKKLALLNPVAKIEDYRKKSVDFAKRIVYAGLQFVKLKEAVFTKAVEKLSNLSPLNILGRGYSITFKMPQEAIVKDAGLIKAGDTIKTKLYKGEIFSQVIREAEDGGSKI